MLLKSVAVKSQSLTSMTAIGFGSSLSTAGKRHTFSQCVGHASLFIHLFLLSVFLSWRINSLPQVCWSFLFVCPSSYWTILVLLWIINKQWWGSFTCHIMACYNSFISKNIHPAGFLLSYSGSACLKETEQQGTNVCGSFFMGLLEMQPPADGK